MPRGKFKSKKEPSKLLQAMQFLSVCQKDEADNDSQMYCNMQANTAIAFDGIIAAGIRIEEEFNACPHTQQMVLALSRCGNKTVITQLSPDRLQIRSEGFEAYVPCCKRERLTAVNPDAGTLPVSDALASAIQIVAPLASDKGEVLEAASIKINANSVIATNREILMEAWHGSNLSIDNLLIPKVAAAALGKIKKKIVGIGVKSNHTFPFSIQPDEIVHEHLTFWFDDGSWLRTNLFKGKWREFALKLPSEKVRPIPTSFFETIAKVLPFSEDDKVYCAQGRVGSHCKDQTGAGYSLPVEDGPIDKIYKGKNLLFAGKHSTMIDEETLESATMFYGPTTRCAVWHSKLIND